MRDRSLDFFRGIAALNIIIIHTFFWSGEKYIPQIVQSFVLLIDVPFFLFLAGWSFVYCKSINRNIYHLFLIWSKWVGFVCVFGGICCFLGLRGIGDTLDFLKNLFFDVSFSAFPVFSGSMWYMPVYISVLLAIGTIILIIKKTADSKNTIANLFYIIVAMYFYNQFGGVILNLSGQFLFYSAFFLLGYVSKDTIISKEKMIILEIVNISAILYLGGVLNINVLDLQRAKFPPTIIYGLASLIFITLTIYIRPFLADNSFKWVQHVGKNAIYYYFSQGISSSLIYYWVDAAVLKRMNPVVIAGIAITINLVIATIIAEIYRLIYERIYMKVNDFNTNIR